jgi:hypothetical protein
MQSDAAGGDALNQGAAGEQQFFTRHQRLLSLGAPLQRAP